MPTPVERSFRKTRKRTISLSGIISGLFLMTLGVLVVLVGLLVLPVAIWARNSRANKPDTSLVAKVHDFTAPLVWAGLMTAIGGYEKMRGAP